MPDFSGPPVVDGYVAGLSLCAFHQGMIEVSYLSLFLSLQNVDHDHSNKHKKGRGHDCNCHH